MIDRFFLSAMDLPAPKMLALPAESTIVERLAAIGDLAPSLPLNVCAKSGNASKEATALEVIAGLKVGSKDWKRDYNLCLHTCNVDYGFEFTRGDSVIIMPARMAMARRGGNCIYVWIAHSSCLVSYR